MTGVRRWCSASAETPCGGRWTTRWLPAFGALSTGATYAWWRDPAAGRTGITPSKAGPFVECLGVGHEHSDECPASLADFRDRIAELDRMIASLTTRRAVFVRRLDDSATEPADRRRPR